MGGISNLIKSVSPYINKGKVGTYIQLPKITLKFSVKSNGTQVSLLATLHVLGTITLNHPKKTEAN